ncbi:hypothetical protein P3T36_004586 [Kitasatospora sp. MAP12-15]|uniref:hypothetical protein n=1 Tax=unclassified Kitasatospora TaxID=2633591 RepID=UPI002476A2CB|nr:hypothetical protein [Kitasatospora sp. MAP12-44]MDH6111432.1 hypothetical protein [Kitasatospora sp. MAP12-44]
MSAELLSVFELNPQTIALSAIRENYADTEGDTTGDGCGESPPQGATTGCAFPGQL